VVPDILSGAPSTVLGWIVPVLHARAGCAWHQLQYDKRDSRPVGEVA
jgi:hypothetical protein